jgi:hypothetical protein
MTKTNFTMLTLAVCASTLAGISVQANSAGKCKTECSKKQVVPKEAAKYHKARIDVNGQSKQVELKPVKGCANVNWWKKTPEKGKQYLCGQSKALKGDVWEEMEIAFIPQKDGYVAIRLRGGWYCPKGQKKNIPLWVEFDELEVTGAKLKNSGFEKITAKGNAVGWTGGKLCTKNPAGGKSSIKVWHNKPADQSIQVKKGQKVTIKAKVKKVK